MTRNLRPRPDLGVEAKVSVAFPSAAQARAAVKALIPDNVNMPAGLTINVFSRGRVVWVHVAGNGVPVAMVASTLDEVLEHISVARRVMPDA